VRGIWVIQVGIAISFLPYLKHYIAVYLWHHTMLAIICMQLLFGLTAGYCWNVTADSCAWSGPPPCGMNVQTYCTLMCQDGCQRVYQNIGCLNATKSLPDSSMVYSQSCFGSTPYAATDYRCNVAGSGTVCPFGCVKESSSCAPLINTSVCDNAIVWTCPDDCIYMADLHTCQPATPYSVCKLIKENLICPKGCAYNEHFDKCISLDPNSVCELTKRMRCPSKCQLNPRGDMCVPITGTEICSRSDHQICPLGCNWDSKQQLCVLPQPWNRVQNAVCELVVKMYCPFPDSLALALRYDNDVNRYPYCVSGLLTDICFDNGVGVMYPARLRKKYDNSVRCKYSQPYCRSITQICCS